jgi:cobalt-zinc-cadmium efflux system membrane fusion protein
MPIGGGDEADRRAGAVRSDDMTRRRRRRLRWSLAAGALLCALGVGWRVFKPSQSAAGSVATAERHGARDVPYVDGKGVAFSRAFADRTGIKLSAVRRAPLTPVVKVVGTVDFNPRQVAAVGARIQGFVRRVMALPGDMVSVGDPLAEIESAGLGQAQADLSVARAHSKAAEMNARRESTLLKQGLTTAREAEVASATLSSQEASLQAAQQRVLALGGRRAGRLGVYILRAPLRGNVVESHISVGQSVEADLVAFRVANLDDLWIDLSVFERTIGMVRIGDLVEVTPMADVKTLIRGKVAHVSEVLDLNTRSGKVRVQVDNKNRLLRPGQSVTAVIHAATPTHESLSVPFEAITYVDGRPTVFVANGPTRVTPTPVELGVSDGRQQEILSGVREGQSVVSQGVFALKSELFR